MTADETLCRAAALMRERAEVAAAATGSGSWDGCCASPLHGVHVASWPPAVAFAVADLLDEAANGIEVMGPLDWDYPMGPMDSTGSLRPEFRGALNVASVYLGEST